MKVNFPGNIWMGGSDTTQEEHGPGQMEHLGYILIGTLGHQTTMAQCKIVFGVTGMNSSGMTSSGMIIPVNRRLCSYARNNHFLSKNHCVDKSST